MDRYERRYRVELHPLVISLDIITIPDVTILAQVVISAQ
jgi:hypothetical protein